MGCRDAIFIISYVVDFLSIVNSRSRSLYAVARPSVCLSSVCNVRAPYSGGFSAIFLRH